jgi:hypothetical protein
VNLKLVGTLVVALVLLASACGDSKHHASAVSTETSSTSEIPSLCRAPSPSCRELTETDLPDPFIGFPEIQHAYQNQRRFDVYTSLGTAKTELAFRICTSVLGDLLGNPPSDPLIIVYSADGIPLANGGSEGCSAIGGDTRDTGSTGGTGGGSGSNALTTCAQTHAVGVDDVTVKDISCTEARRLASTNGDPDSSDLSDAGFTCTKTGEGTGYTVWRCASPDATFAYRFYGDD